jgi:hypothetical protein
MFLGFNFKNLFVKSAKKNRTVIKLTIFHKKEIVRRWSFNNLRNPAWQEHIGQFEII